MLAPELKRDFNASNCEGKSMKNDMRKFCVYCCALLLSALLLVGMCAGCGAVDTAPDEQSGRELPQVSDLSEVTDGLPQSFIGQLDQHAAEQSQEYTPEELAAIADFYAQSAFVGDSLLVGFRSFIQKNDTEASFARSAMLAAYSYSTRAALMPISENTVHPFYMGAQRQVWDSINLAGAKRVFLMFWANEIPFGDIEKARSNMEGLIDTLRQQCPGLEIYVVSPCFKYDNPNHHFEYLTNDNFALLAAAQKELCEEKGAGYIEVAKYLGNQTDGLYGEYTADGYVHVNDAAYEIWRQVLMAYALGREAVIDNGHSY